MRCALKTPYRDGTTHVIFEPEDFIARLVALVPKPRAHLTRYHACSRQRVRYGIAPHDPLSYAAASVLLLATTICAALIPLRASRIDPTAALRDE